MCLFRHFDGPNKVLYKTPTQETQRPNMKQPDLPVYVFSGKRLETREATPVVEGAREDLQKVLTPEERALDEFAARHLSVTPGPPTAREQAAMRQPSTPPAAPQSSTTPRNKGLWGRIFG